MPTTQAEVVQFQTVSSRPWLNAAACSGSRDTTVEIVPAADLFQTYGVDANHPTGIVDAAHPDGKEYLNGIAPIDTCQVKIA